MPLADGTEHLRRTQEGLWIVTTSNEGDVAADPIRHFVATRLLPE